MFWCPALVIGVCMAELAASQYQELCGNHFARGTEGLLCSAGHEGIAKLMILPFIARYQREHSPELGTDLNGTCDQGTDAQLYCYTEIPEPVRCQPMPNPGMNMSGLCADVWYLLQLLAPLRTPDNDSEFLRHLSRLAVFYCNSSAPPNCPQPKNHLALESRCYYPYVHQPSATRFLESYRDGVYDVLERLADDMLLYINRTKNAGFLTEYNCIVEGLLASGLYENATALADQLVGSLHFDLVQSFVPVGALIEPVLETFIDRAGCVSHCEARGTLKDTGIVSLISNWVRVLFFISFSMPALIGAAGWIDGFKSLWRYPDRLMLYLAASSFFYGLYLAPHFFQPLTGDKMRCNADNSTKDSEQLKASGSAQFSCLTNQLGLTLYRAILLFISFAWWQLVVQLDLCMRQTWYCVKVEGRGEVIALSLISIGSSASTYRQSTRQYGAWVMADVCGTPPSINVDNIIEAIMVGLSIGLVLDGCRRLYTISKTSQGSVLARSSDGTGGDLVKAATVVMARRYLFFLSSMLVCSATLDLTTAWITVVPPEEWYVYYTQHNEYSRCTSLTCGNLEPCRHLLADIPPTMKFQILLAQALDTLSAFLIIAGIFLPYLRKSRQRRRKKRHKPVRSRASSEGFASKRTPVTTENVVDNSSEPSNGENAESKTKAARHNYLDSKQFGANFYPSNVPVGDVSTPTAVTLPTPVCMLTESNV